MRESCGAGRSLRALSAWPVASCYVTAPSLLRSYRAMSSLHTSRSAFLWSLLCVAALAGAGCASTGTSAGAADEKEDKDDDDLKALTKKLELSKLELELAKLEAEQEVASAERELAEARVESEKA